MNKKTINFIIASKNDNYCGNPLDRLKISLLHNLEILKDYDNWTITIVDWASDIKISDALNIVHPKVEFLYINKEIAGTIPYKFSEVHSLNSAIRLSSSDFIGRLDQDIMIGPKFIEWYFNNEIPYKFFHCKRKDLYENVNCINGEGVNNCDIDTPSCDAADGIILAPTVTLKKITGYNEKNIYFNHMQKELYIRLKSKLEFVDLTPIIGYDFYHLWHTKIDPERIYNENINGDIKLHIVANDPKTWGLSQYNIQKYKLINKLVSKA